MRSPINKLQRKKAHTNHYLHCVKLCHVKEDLSDLLRSEKVRVLHVIEWTLDGNPKVNTLIILDVHARDIVDRFVRDSTSSAICKGASLQVFAIVFWGVQLLLHSTSYYLLQIHVLLPCFHEDLTSSRLWRIFVDNVLLNVWAENNLVRIQVNVGLFPLEQTHGS